MLLSVFLSSSNKRGRFQSSLQLRNGRALKVTMNTNPSDLSTSQFICKRNWGDVVFRFRGISSVHDRHALLAPLSWQTIGIEHLNAEKGVRIFMNWSVYKRFSTLSIYFFALTWLCREFQSLICKGDLASNVPRDAERNESHWDSIRARWDFYLLNSYPTLIRSHGQ